MYYIQKYPDCWAIHDQVTAAGRKLTIEEIKKLKTEFPILKDDAVITVSIENVKSIALFKRQYQDLLPPESNLEEQF